MSGLLDLLQSASNAAAGNVSGPVDALAWLLRKAGIPVPEPVGGSEWMARQGLTRQVEPGAAQVAGETLGLLSPVVAAAKAPQIASGLLQMGENLAAPGELSPQAGVINVLFRVKDTFRPENYRFLPDGTLVIDKGTAGFNTPSDFADKAFQLAKQEYIPQYDHYFRFTNNKGELGLARSGLIRPSFNHADNIPEAGLSVADWPHYGLQGYRYGYRVNGPVIGYGSDGEPLLDTKNLEVLSKRLSSAVDIMMKDKARTAKALKARGLPEDYFSGGVNLLNRPNEIDAPYPSSVDAYRRALDLANSLLGEL